MPNTTQTVEVLLKDAADLAETLIPPSSLVGRMVVVLAKQVEQLTGKTLAPLPAEVLNPKPPDETPTEQTPATPPVSDREQELADRLAKLEALLPASKEN